MCLSGDGCRWDPHSKACSGDDDDRRMKAQHWRDELGVIDAAATEDVWYSTLEAGHCRQQQHDDSSSTSSSSAPCTWRIVRIDAVRSRRCVNDHIIAPVLERNHSCFKGCPQPRNRSSDCWISCWAIGTLGDASTGAPAIGSDGSAATTGALLLRRFKEAMNENANICPQQATNQSVDSSTSSPVGVHELTLYRLTPPFSASNTSFANTNSVDALGLLAVLRGDIDDSLKGLRPGQTIVQASVSVNHLFGELTLCSTRNDETGTVSCAPQWNCTCQDHEGSPRTCEGDDSQHPCECRLWGGCPSLDNVGVMSVGRRASGGRSGRTGRVYSTMAGGECDGWHSPCSWRQLSIGIEARTDCLRVAMRSLLGDDDALSDAVVARLVATAFAGCRS